MGMVCSVNPEKPRKLLLVQEYLFHLGYGITVTGECDTGR
jgi:hypothetical protein